MNTCKIFDLFIQYLLLVSALVALLIFQSGIVVFIIAALSFYQLISNFIHLLNSHTNSRESIIYFQGFFWLILTILLMFMVIPAGGFGPYTLLYLLIFFSCTPPGYVLGIACISCIVWYLVISTRESKFIKL